MFRLSASTGAVLSAYVPEILEQDVPGHCIHGEMMDCQEQATWNKPNRLQQDPLSGVQPALSRS